MRQKILKKILVVMVLCCLLGTLASCSEKEPKESAEISDEEVPWEQTPNESDVSEETSSVEETLEEITGILIQETDADLQIIPDKYNCGAKGELKVVTAGEIVNEVRFKVSADRNVLEFGYGNKDISGTVFFENIDFSGNDMAFYNEGLVDRDIKVVFKNCLFGQIKSGQNASRMQYEFINCTLQSFYGSNATFDRCLFGGTYKDTIIPFQNVTVRNCYIQDLASDDPAGSGSHSDGTQMYGHKNAEVVNVRFDNCRFEIPAIKYGENSASVNACIMVQLEYNNGRNIHFTNCKINGGGYAIYARATRQDLYLEDVTFEDISVGCAMLFRTLYPDVSEAVVLQNVKEADALYVSSVWQEGETTHLSVSNDTNKERKLLVCTDSGNYCFTIPKCPNGKNLYQKFEDFPFDVDIKIDKPCEYIVCYEVSSRGELTQIRFANMTDGEVYLNPEEILSNLGIEIDSDAGEETGDDMEAILLSGECGKDAQFSLYESGLLVITGNGATFNYDTKNAAPWYDLRDEILTVRIEEGISQIGNQAFRDCGNILEVTLPESLEIIGSNAFIRCASLIEICIPIGVREIGQYAFAGTGLRKCIYEGSAEEWSKIAIGKKNEVLTEKLRMN